MNLALFLLSVCNSMDFMENNNCFCNCLYIWVSIFSWVITTVCIRSYSYVYSGIITAAKHGFNPELLDIKGHLMHVLREKECARGCFLSFESRFLSWFPEIKHKSEMDIIVLSWLRCILSMHSQVPHLNLQRPSS